MRACVEKIRLHLRELVIERRGRPARACDANERIELVDRTVGLDARIVLRDACAAEKRRLAVVAGAGVDLQPLLRFELFDALLHDHFGHVGDHFPRDVADDLLGHHLHHALGDAIDLLVSEIER